MDVTLFTNLVCAVFKSDSISYFVTEINTHFLGHTLSNRHCSNTSRLGATNHAVVRVSILVQVLQHVTRQLYFSKATRLAVPSQEVNILLLMHMAHIRNAVLLLHYTVATKSVAAGFGRHGMPPPASNDTVTGTAFCFPN